MIDLAFAQGAPGQGPGGLLPQVLASQLPVFLLIGVVFYMLLIRPQQKKAKDHQAMLGQLKKNDEVVTSGGIYGKVVALTETIVTLEVAPNVRIRVNRPQISDIVTGDKAKDAKES
ncbi:MAG TPA: preprotein translocase subunit YajC [Candidatus Binatia bacterium]|jgi:preprotein translocase subunit YajC